VKKHLNEAAQWSVHGQAHAVPPGDLSVERDRERRRRSPNRAKSCGTRVLEHAARVVRGDTTRRAANTARRTQLTSSTSAP
jgi:hypothetical protein